MRAEENVARDMGLDWSLRGPPGPSEGGPKTWRGQNYREGNGKWANRGGKHRKWFTAYYKAKTSGKLDEFLAEHGKGKSKGKGSQQDKCTCKGSGSKNSGKR